MTIQLWMVNNSGSLMYSFTDKYHDNFSANFHLTNSSSLSTISALAAQCSPLGGSGFTQIETTETRWICFSSPTGINFFLCTKKNMPINIAQRKIYAVYRFYTVFVLRNPFCIPGQTIKCQKFEQNAEKVLME
ncbi:Sybindin-like family protein [Spironucleus salmonicida]|uniref:Trafficking protein particle complex subunit n=1 Tax=Spironucleus salmonicida TaxID=348837 RepID=V6LNI3_9EUKA|nr:Sybindin-like family protein [Spironucleus salmonicida]|eukprot:EST45281.1 Sybindin-like family protein [Spironucleus salmonicida]